MAKAMMFLGGALICAGGGIELSAPGLDWRAFAAYSAGCIIFAGGAALKMLNSG